MKGKGLEIRLEDCVDLFGQDVLEVLLGIICIPSAPSFAFVLSQHLAERLQGFQEVCFGVRKPRRVKALTRDRLPNSLAPPDYNPRFRQLEIAVMTHGKRSHRVKPNRKPAQRPEEAGPNASLSRAAEKRATRGVGPV